jgi:uncharacterized coiled-coil protein SlyX
MIWADFRWQLLNGAVVGLVARRHFLFVEGENSMADTVERGSQAEAPSPEAETDTLVPAGGRSRRILVVIASLLVLAMVGAAAAYALPNVALPDFSSLAELLPHNQVSAPIPNSVVTAALQEIQSTQQQHATALQENGSAIQQDTALLQQDAATLELIRQSFTAQQTDLKRISNQLAALTTRIDSIQNAVTPLTTSSISQPNAHARLVSRKRTSRLPKPIGPVSVGGAPLGSAPVMSAGAG